jgi:glycosyltransferase involved in cell wall biosynthesis
MNNRSPDGVIVAQVGPVQGGVAVEPGLVSVMMPAYNAERYIAQSIESLLAQEYSTWELIIVNDGSRDKTAEIAAGYGGDPRVKLVHQANGGEAAARNTALRHMSGEYLAFLDADDLYLPGALGNLCRFLDAHPEYGVVFSDGYFCDSEGRSLNRRLSEIRPGIYTGDILEPLVLNPAVITVPACVMLRRDSVERHELRFDTHLFLGTDWDFWIGLARYTRFGYLDRLTCMYRVHTTNITRTRGQQKRLDDWVAGREKVMKSDWFHKLSLPTRYRFFDNLLVELLSGPPTRHTAILESEAFQCLPAGMRAQLWRRVGIEYLLEQRDTAFAHQCLEEAVRLQPHAWKSRCLLWAASHLGKPAAGSVLRVWRLMVKATNGLKSLGRNRPKPVPAQLSFIRE